MNEEIIQKIYDIAVNIVAQMAGEAIVKAMTPEELFAALSDSAIASTHPEVIKTVGRRFDNRDFTIFHYTVGPGSIIIRCAKQYCPDGFKNPIGDNTVFYMSAGSVDKAFFAPGPWVDLLARFNADVPQLKENKKREEEIARKREKARSDVREQSLEIARKLGDALRPLGEWHCDKRILVFQDAAHNVTAYERIRTYKHSPYTVQKVLDTSFATPSAVRGDWVIHALNVVEKKLRNEPYEYFRPNGFGYNVYWSRFN